MKPTRRAATIAGVLFLVGTAAGVLSVVGAADGPDYLQAVAADGSRVVAGALFQCTMAAAYVGAALALHPVLTRHAPTAAAGFLGFRIAAAVLNVVGAIALLLLLELSTQYMSAGAPGSSHFQAVGGVLRHARDLTNHYAVIIALCAGDAMYYWILYRARLVPRWLPIWGFIGLLLAMSASLLVFGGLIEVVTPTYLCLTAVLSLQQLALAAWLIIRGLDAGAGVGEPTPEGHSWKVLARCAPPVGPQDGVSPGVGPVLDEHLSGWECFQSAWCPRRPWAPGLQPLGQSRPLPEEAPSLRPLYVDDISSSRNLRLRAFGRGPEQE